ncbi:MAG: hypothetical protein WCL50_05155, partial [Spirochaetota bacterium]
MIHESYYWKQPLLVSAGRLKRYRKARQLGQKQLLRIEKDVLIGFYSVRKLLETPFKISDGIKKATY